MSKNAAYIEMKHVVFDALDKRRAGNALDEQSRQMLECAFTAAQQSLQHANGDPILHPSDGSPFVMHVLRVALELVERFAVQDPVAIAGALAHDIVENGLVSIHDTAVAGYDDVISISNDLAAMPRERVSGLDLSNTPLTTAGCLAADLDDAANVARKWEHYQRLLTSSVHSFSPAIKLADNIVAYGGRYATTSVRQRQPYEVALFEAFAERFPLDSQPLASQDLRDSIDQAWAGTANVNAISKRVELVAEAARLLEQPFPY